jgi:hypothetical protein
MNSLMLDTCLNVGFISIYRRATVSAATVRATVSAATVEEGVNLGFLALIPY